ncbi:anthranilate phosphoribosyltransferase [Opitutus sp. ER46]|uniref:anthranilate phosphoribosyltransferase n=1 Tax=Opitutus sp. ER46 TaxID=2161864 RepID=UPI000D32211B|nr:anthranilate phosphoribosyltransferase [Opitutus sp. ER46]PTX91167.1 anthranilate phosphoribosyltransferase [Opitutus sp. ER46]
MSTLPEMTAQLGLGRELTADQVEIAAAALAAGEIPDGLKAEFLETLAKKGETPGEIAAFAAAFRKRAIDPGVGAWSELAIDIVGTGGDHAGGFNVSSVVVLVLAAAGVPVMKHGNRGVTSKCGSADLLAGLGVDLEAAPEKLQRALQELGFVFFYAPAYHPTFRHIAPVRKALAARGQRTVFNILGTLINPGRPAHVLLGAYSAALVPKLAGALQALGAKAGIAVHGVLGLDRGIDELTTASPNRVRGFGRLEAVDGEWNAPDFGLKVSPFSDLVGGDVATNLGIVEALLDGRGPAGLADTVALNAAVSMWIVGRQPSVRDGIGLARELLLGGAVKQKIADTREFFRS